MTGGVLCGLAAGALWGQIFLFPLLLPMFSALEQTAARYLAYGAISLLLALPRIGALMRATTRADLLALLGLSACGTLGYYFCVARSVALVGVAPSALVVGLLPLTITLVGRAHRPRAERLPLRRLAPPLALIALGMLLVNAPALAAAHRAGSALPLAGLGWAVGAVVCWTVYAVGNASWLRAHARWSARDWNDLTGLTTGLLALLLLPALPWSGAAFDADRPWLRLLTVALALAVTTSNLGAWLWNIASRRLPITLTGQLLVSETVFALLYGFAWAGHWPDGRECAAIAVLLGGVLWAIRLHRAA
ncbi:DMT family transporter [Derxia lacustris]|uniref:DMT family transporter n=1 Tax=Derxia lacustris TaxID=764842 RepID=UPI00111BE693|nr:DMT family transporter [Derxia lacustris]